MFKPHKIYLTSLIFVQIINKIILNFCTIKVLCHSVYGVIILKETPITSEKTDEIENISFT